MCQSGFSRGYNKKMKEPNCKHNFWGYNLYEESHNTLHMYRIRHLKSQKNKTMKVITQRINHLFSRNVFALETFFPMAEAFQEKYEPEGSTYSANKHNTLEDDFIWSRIKINCIAPNNSNNQWHFKAEPQWISLSNLSVAHHSHKDVPRHYLLYLSKENINERGKGDKRVRKSGKNNGKNEK